MKRKLQGVLLCCAWLLVGQVMAQAPKMQVLVFSKTASFRHESIAAGKAALVEMAKAGELG